MKDKADKSTQGLFPQTWWKIGRDDSPTPVNVIAETAQTVTVSEDGYRPHKALKLSHYGKLVRTEREAWEHLLSRAEDKLATARENVVEYEQAVMNIQRELLERCL